MDNYTVTSLQYVSMLLNILNNYSNKNKYNTNIGRNIFF